MKFKIIVVVVATALLFHLGDTTRPYIERCKRNDPNLNDCILRSAKKAVPELMKGDKTLHIPNLHDFDPLDQVLHFNGITYNIRRIKPTSGELTPVFARMDFEGQSAEIGMHLPFLVWKADFQATGDYKGKNIDASGRVTINYDNVQINYTKNFNDINYNGKTHLQIVSGSTVGSIDQISVQQNYDENAIGRDELDTLTPELKSALQQNLQNMCSELVTTIMNLVLLDIPKNDLFLS